MRLYHIKKCDRNGKEREKEVDFDLTQSRYKRLVLNKL